MLAREHSHEQAGGELEAEQLAGAPWLEVEEPIEGRESKDPVVAHALRE